MHFYLYFKINRDNQIMTRFLGIILFTNISITCYSHYQRILISEMYKAMCYSFFLITSKVKQFWNCNDCIGKISSISIINNLNLFETLIVLTIQNNFFVKLLWSNDLEISNISITKIKSNFPWKRDLKSDEEKNKHSFALYEGIFKFRPALLV